MPAAVAALFFLPLPSSLAFSFSRSPLASAHPWRVDHEAKHFVAFLTRLGSPLLDNRAPHRGIITRVDSEEKRRIDGFGGSSIEGSFVKVDRIVWIIRIVSFLFSSLNLYQFNRHCRSLIDLII